MLEKAGKRSEDQDEGCIGGVEDEKVHHSPRLEESRRSSTCCLYRYIVETTNQTVRHAILLLSAHLIPRSMVRSRAS